LFKVFRIGLTSSLSASVVLLATAEEAKASGTYDFTLPPLKSGCLISLTHPDCYADQNVIRASSFSHDDGTDAPRLIPVGSVPPLLQKTADNPLGNTLWQRLKNILASTPAPLHVIDQSKSKSSIGTMFGREIYVDQDYNQWTQFSGDWFVLMSNQFNQNNPRKKALWCGDLITCDGSRNYASAANKGSSPLFFAPVLAELAPQPLKDKFNLGDWLRSRPAEYDLTKPETVHARANFLVGGRGIGSFSGAPDQAAWNHVAYVWVDPDQLFRPAQNSDITIAEIATVANHFDPVQFSPSIEWCIRGLVSSAPSPSSCLMAEPALGSGTLFNDFDNYYLSYFESGSNQSRSDYFPFPFTGLGVTYDPYYQALLESSTTEAELALVLPKLIGTSEFIYALPTLANADTTPMYVDRVFPIMSLFPTPGPLPIVGAFTGFAFSRRLRHRIRRASTGR
jgi:hypothetical protein